MPSTSERYESVKDQIVKLFSLKHQLADLLSNPKLTEDIRKIRHQIVQAEFALFLLTINLILSAIKGET